MSIYDTYAIDPEIESNGVWVDTLSDPERFLLTYTDSPKYRDFYNKLIKPRLHDIRKMLKIIDRGETPPESISQFILDCELKAFCRYALLGWENVTDEAGNPLEYSPETAFELLSKPTLRRLKDALFEEAQKLSGKRQTLSEDAEKN